jgi:hypothetical protein
MADISLLVNIMDLRYEKKVYTLGIVRLGLVDTFNNPRKTVQHLGQRPPKDVRSDEYSLAQNWALAEGSAWQTSKNNTSSFWLQRR